MGVRQHWHTEPATGHDSPTSILCLQCPSRVSFQRLPCRACCAGRTGPSSPWKVARATAQITASMGFNEHLEALRQAELRVDQVKVSL
jgi:hypothetical protein